MKLLVRLMVTLWFPWLVCAQEKPQAAPRRFAFLVGNSAYTGGLPPLAAARSDTRLIADKLRGAGFLTTVVEDGRMPALMFPDETAFLSQLQPGDVVFFYFSGYSVQGTDEDDYLLPVNFKPDSGISAANDALNLSRILQDLNVHQVGIKMVMIEGPPQLNTPIKGATGEGLLLPDMRDMGEILFAMSSPPGQPVVPSAAGADLYTQEVAAQLDTPGLTPREVFERAQESVNRKTGLKQNPFLYQNLVTTFYFHAPKPVEKIETRRTDVQTNSHDREEYVYIPAGSFKMGCVPADPRCEPNEKPQHDVTISKGFYLGRNEVDVNAYTRFTKIPGSKQKMPTAPPNFNGWKTTNIPITMVRWDQARDYCAWVGGRLPTEAEWEYAARGGASEEIYPMNSENSRDKANFDGKGGNDIYDGVAPVRSFDPNPFNLYDMAGNVWEWVSDFYDPKYYASSPAMDPQGPETGKEHVARGGSFESDPKKHLRLSYRRPQSIAFFSVGFRCLLEDTPEVQKEFIAR